MNSKRPGAILYALLFSFLILSPLLAEDFFLGLALTNGQKQLQLPLLSGIDEFLVYKSSDITANFQKATGGILKNYIWTEPLGQTQAEFFKLAALPMSSNSLVNAILLNRLAYGPTPDDLDHVAGIGPDAYIEEQLAPENIQEQLEIDQVNTTTNWRYVTFSGTGTSSTLYIYLTVAGDCYLDDIKLVRGTIPESGFNYIKNGDFETALAGSWNISTNLTNSIITPDVTHGGVGALHVIANAPGTTKASAIWQTFSSSLTTSTNYTLSFWYKPGTNLSSGLVVRLSGSTTGTGIYATPDTLASKLNLGLATIDDLRAWHVLHAVRSKKQLLETMLQFLDNHFVTEYKKDFDYLDRYYSSSGNTIPFLATQLEFKELQRWRAALNNPQCTFYDLLKISAESPAMIIYLDTVDSNGSGSNIANENYARELLELFTFGVDNGYDQNDITVLSRAWTGWSVNIVDREKEFYPFAPRTTRVITGATNTGIASLDGVWTFNYKQANHNTSSKTIFAGKTVPVRFGVPYAGRNYQLDIPSRTGTNGIQDGYQVIAHLANQPFTQEFISVKLCRLFVHEDFATGYDFTDPNLSAEGKLIRECMRAWEQGAPKGQIRDVLRVIFNSDLFRGQTAASHKVKTPFEYCAGVIRSLQARLEDGTYTADTDGYSIYSPMDRMGRMRLFDREEPDGYPEFAAGWISAGTLAERLRFAQSALLASGQTGKSDAGEGNRTDPVKLLKAKLASSDWNNAEAAADLFLKLLFPVEGLANIESYKALALTFLNTADDGQTASPFSGLLNTSATYDTRVRGLVGMLMTLQLFQEQ